MPLSSRGGTRVSSVLIARQMERNERKTSRVGRGSLCEPFKFRKTVFLFPFLWQAIPVTMRPDCDCWATSRRRSARRALQVHVINGSFCRFCHASHISFSFGFLCFSLPKLVDDARGSRRKWFRVSFRCTR